MRQAKRSVQQAASVYRITMDRELMRLLDRLEPGLVLDVGSKDSPYRKHIAHTRYVCLDVDASRNPDIVCDLHDLEWSPNYFDTIVALNVFEHLQDPQRAVDRIFNVLKPGGVFILTTPFLSGYTADPKDYFRYTPDSLEYLLRGFDRVQITEHGNRAQAIWDLVCAGRWAGMVLGGLSSLVAKFDSRETDFPLGFVVYSEK